MPLLDDPTAGVAAGAPDSSPTPPTRGGLLYDPTAGIAAGEDSGSAYVTYGGRSTWADVGHGWMAGGHQAAADVAGAFAATAQYPSWKRAAQTFATGQEEAARESEEAMTPAARQPGFLKHPLVSSAEAIPPLIPLAGAAAAGTAVAGPVGGALASSAMFGAQTLGQAQNRAAGEGVELTTGEKLGAFGAGAGAGLISAGAGALTGKLVASPIVKYALGVIEPGTTFAGAGAGQEAISEHAEIRTGKRQDYDIGQIAQEGLSQGLFGASFGALHLPGRGEKLAPDSKVIEEKPAEEKPAEEKPAEEPPPGGGKGQAQTQTPGEATVGRNKPTATDGSTKPHVPPTATGRPGLEKLKRKPAEGDKAGGVASVGDTNLTPDTKTALDNTGKSAKGPEVAPDSKETTALSSETPPQVVATAPPAQEAPARPPAPAATASVSPQPRPPEPQPAPAPAPAGPSLAVLEQRANEMMDPTHPREGLVYPPGVPGLPRHGNVGVNSGRWGQTKLKDGRVVQYDTRGPQTLNKFKVLELERTGRLDRLEGLPPEERPAPQPTPQKAPVETKEEQTKTATPAPDVAAAETAPEPSLEKQIVSRQVELEERAEAERQASAQAAQSHAALLKQMIGEHLAAGKPYEHLMSATFEDLQRIQRGEKVTTEGKADRAGASGILTPEQEKLRDEQTRKREAQGGEAAAPKPEPPGKARVLRAISEKEKEKATREQAEAERAAAFEKNVVRTASGRVKRVTKPIEEQKPSKDTKRAKANVANNELGNEIVNKPEHIGKDEDAAAALQGDRGAQRKVLDRANKMVEAARAAKFKFFDKLKPRVGEAERHSPGAVLLDSAKRLVEKGQQEKLKDTDYNDFLWTEHELRENGEAGYQNVMEKRRAEGREWAAATGRTPEIATEDVGEAKGEEPVGAVEDREIEKLDAAREAAKAAEARRLEAEKEPKQLEPPEEKAEGPKLLGETKPEQTEEERMAARRAESEAMRAEAKEKPKQPAVAGFQVSKKRTFKKPSGDLLAHEADEDVSLVETKDADGKETTIAPLRTVTVREAIAKLWKPDHYAPELRPMLQKLVERIIDIVGDKKVHILSDADMRKLRGGERTAYGLYDPRPESKDAIYFNAENWTQETALHEPFHAATIMGLRKDPELRGLLKDLHNEVMDKLTPEQLDSLPGQAVLNMEEFVTYLMTSPRLQEVVKNIKISDDLAKALDIPKWRKATVWEGFLSALRKFFGLNPRETSAIEAAMAITERAMHARDPGEQMAFAGRYDRAMQAQRARVRRMIEKADPSLLAHDEEKTPGLLAKVTDKLPQAVKDIPFNNATEFKRKHLAAMSLTQIEGMHGAKFDGKLKPVINAAMETDQIRRELHKADEDFINRAYKLADKYDQHMGAFGNILDESSKFDIHADQDAPPPGKKGGPEDRAGDKWQANHNWDRVRNALKQMPEELQKFYTDLKKWYAGKAEQLATAQLKNLIELHGTPKGVTPEEMLRRIREKDMEQADVDHYVDAGAAKDIINARRFLDRKAVYFNAFRDGDNVVTGRYDMPEGGDEKAYSGEQLEDDTREFSSRKEAHDFMVGTKDEPQRMHGTMDIVRYARDTKEELHGEKEIEKAEARAKNNIEERYQVRLQREHTEIHVTPADAQRAREEMIKAGVKDVSQVLDKHQNEAWTKINSHSAQMLENKINDSDMSPTEKNHAIQIARQMVLMTQSGNRLQRHWITRRNIAGAKFEAPEAIRAYSHSANFHIAQMQTLNKLDRALKAMAEQEKLARGSKDGMQISAIANVFRDRIYGGPDAAMPQTPYWVRALITASFSKYLLGTRFIIQHQFHPIAFSVPQMAGRHGYINSFKGQAKALSDVGGNLYNIKTGLRAARDNARAFLEGDNVEKATKLARQLNMNERIINRVENDKNNPNAKMDARALREGLKRGRLQSGWEDELYGATKLDRVNIMMRQMTNAMEATNRASTFLNAFRLEYAKVKDYEKAVDYATGVIDATQGVYSPTNIATMFRHPYLKGFMQFKQFPIQQAYSLARNVYHAFKDAGTEEGKEAAKAFGYQMLSAATMSGVYGLPIAMLKPIGLLMMALGGPSPSQLSDRFYRMLTDTIGSKGADVITDGVPAMFGSYAPSLTNIFGYNMDFFRGEPRDGDWKSYAWDTIAGAPGSTITEAVGAMGDLYHGDVARAMGKLIPVAEIANMAKAYTLATEGVKTKAGLEVAPSSWEDVAWRGLGFTTQPIARAWSGRTALEEDIQQLKAEKQDVLSSVRKGDMSAVYKWNSANPQDKITPAQIQQIKRGQSAPSVLGVPETPKKRALLERYRSAYQ